MTTLHAWGRMGRNITDAKIASGTWSKIGRSHYRRETGEEVKKDGRYWNIIRTDGKVFESYLSRTEAMHQVDKRHVSKN